MAPRSTLLLLALAAAPAAAQPAVSTVSPNSRTSVEGNDGNSYPFSAQTISRYQQVFGAGSLAPLAGRQITQIAFRLDGAQHPQGYPGGFLYPQLVIKLSTSTHTPDQLSTNMDANIGPDVRTVYSGPYTLPALSGGPAPRAFDMVITLQTPFPYTAGPLLMEVAGPIGPSLANAFYLDAENTTGDAVSRVYTTSFLDQTFADTRGLIARLSAAGACYPNCDGSTTAPILNVNDFICFQTRFVQGCS